MAVRHCDGVRLGQPCRTLFAVGLMACPNCKSTKHHEFGTRQEDEEHPMAKSTVHGGASDVAVAPVVDETESEEETPTEPKAPEQVEETDEGEADEDDAEAEIPDEVPGEVDETRGPKRPAANDAKAEWVAYAETLGLSYETADGMSKKDLMAAVAAVEEGTATVTDVGDLLIDGQPAN